MAYVQCFTFYLLPLSIYNGYDHMVSLIRRDYLLNTCYQTSTEPHASFARISLNLHNNPTRESSSSALPPAPILYMKESRLNEVKYSPKSMAGKGQRWGCKGSLFEFKTEALFSAQHYFILWGETVDKRQITYLRTLIGKLLFNKSKKATCFSEYLAQDYARYCKDN